MSLTLLGLVIPVRVVLRDSRLCEGMGTLSKEGVTLPNCVPGGSEGNCPLIRTAQKPL